MSFNANNNLKVLHDNNSVFSDITNDSADYTRDSFVVSFTEIEDYIYVGYRKPINALYPDMTGTLVTASTMTGEYFNGTTFTSLENFFDDSRGFSRSGFVTWGRNQTDEIKTTVDSVELFWYRFRVADGTLNFTGLNLLFCDLQDLKNEFKEIDDTNFIDTVGETYIRELTSTRDKIAERLANTRPIDTDTYWDILRIREVRLAATFLCLSQILFNKSDSEGDIYEIKSSFYENSYETTLLRIKATLDSDDDGIEDTIEVNPLAVRWVK